MREHPIIFSAPMVRAILEGRKTQTRRVLKIRGVDGGQYPITSPAEEMLRFDDGTFHYLSTAALSGPYPCPYGQPGDRLWVREAFKDVASGSIKDGYGEIRYGVAYKADAAVIWKHKPTIIHDLRGFDTAPMQFERRPWRPSIHMPRGASRITLEITDVRVERVQDISEEDARAEGVLWVPGHGEIESADLEEGYSNYLNCRDGFQALWDSINAKRGFGWDANPLVWALTFKRVED